MLRLMLILLNVSFLLCSVPKEEIPIETIDEEANIPFKNRFIVPIYFKYGLSIGYNDNVFHLVKL